MAPDLATTNALLAVLAAVSVLEALALVGLFTGGFFLYRRLVQAVVRIEERHVAPVAARVNAILDDVKGVTSVVKQAANGADAGMRSGLAWLIERLRRRAA
jgi:pyrimidine operon attenuation protein/uracil phosphoribosyltransferase